MTTTPVTRRVTAADIARSVGVSRATVGYVLNDTPGQTISTATRERVLETARALGYRPHAAAQALASGRSRLVLLVLPDWPQDYSVRRSIEEAALVLDEAGYTLVTWTPHATGRTRPLWQLLDPDVVFGFVPFPTADVQAMRAHGIRAIVPDPDETATSPDAAEQAGTHGPVLQVRHLYDLGHRRIALASTSDPRLGDLARLRGEVAQRTASAQGMECLAAVAVDAPGVDLSAQVRDWIADGVTGVVAYNDDIAAMVAGAAISTGVVVPDLLSIVGHDDSPLAALFLPALSSIRLDGTGLGRLIADQVLAKIEGRPPLTDAGAALETVVARGSTRRVI